MAMSRKSDVKISDLLDIHSIFRRSDMTGRVAEGAGTGEQISLPGRFLLLSGASCPPICTGDRRASSAVSQSETGDDKPSDREVEAGIDEINRVRSTLRRAGFGDSADALDEAFVKCLRDYVARKSARPRADDDEAGDQSVN